MRISKKRRHEARSASLRRIATPYSYLETLATLRRNFKGVDTKRNAGIVTPAPRDMIFHYGDETIVKVGFLGDIMNIAENRLTYSDALKEWANGHDLMVGNFEATIHDSKDRQGLWWHTNQPQAERIVGDLADLFDPARFHLGLANNHSGDYSRSVFERSNAMLSEAGFPLFGMKDNPTADIHDAVRIVAGTMWSNQHADDLLWLHKPNQAGRFKRDGAVNILYPHWGYELEAWPRRKIAKLGQQFASHYDAVIGHHAHNPQPLAVHGDTPVAYGLGDFCFYYDLPTYKFGMVVSVEIGRPKDGGPPRISSLKWDPIVTRHGDGVLEIDIASKAAAWLHNDEQESQTNTAD